MKKDHQTLIDDNDLRQRAEQKLKEGHQPTATMDVQRLVAELQIHQIELEMQNEELKLSRDLSESLLERYTELYDFAPVSYFTLARNGDIRQTNLTGAAMLGVPRTHLIGSRFGFYTTPETRPAFNTLLENVFESQTTQKCEAVLCNKSNKQIHAQIEALVTRDGEGCRIAVVDITERVQMTEALRQSEERFKALFKHHSAVKLIIDPTTEMIIDANEAAARFYGWSIEELTQMPAQQIDAMATESLKSQVDEAGSCNRSQSECCHKMADGSIRDVEVLCARIDLAGSSVLYSIIHDITDRKNAEAQLERNALRDHHIASTLQQMLIPPRQLMQPPGYEMAARYMPALAEAEVCGDFYDLIDMKDGKIGIVIGDIMGKGLQAAAHVAAIRHTIRSYAYLNHRASSVITLVNEALCREVESADDMLTVFFAVLDTDTGRLTYANAGHEPPLILRSDGRVEPLKHSGAMICGMASPVYAEYNANLRDGDLLVLLTDGIAEARSDSKSALFGEGALERCLSQNIQASAEQMATNIVGCALSFAEGKLRDDVAIVVIRRTG